MLAALILLILGAAAVLGCFYVSGAAGIALAAIGVLLLWSATLAALKHIGLL